EMLRAKLDQRAADDRLDASVRAAGTQRLDQLMLVDAVAKPRPLADHALDVRLLPGRSPLGILRLVQVPVFQDRPKGVFIERNRHVSLLRGAHRASRPRVPHLKTRAAGERFT